MATEAATLIGDIVGSRRASDRSRLHQRITEVLEQVNAELDPVTPLRLTVGDEYQGAFAEVAQAVRASLRLRLALLPEYDVRHGVSWGEVSVLQEEPRVEDGPGWWAAREALHEVERAERRAGSRHRRTAFRPASEVAVHGWVEGYLVLRDELLGGLSERSVSVLRGLLEGRSQKEIAADLSISPSAVSQRVRADGLAAILTADENLEGDPR